MKATEIEKTLSVFEQFFKSELFKKNSWGKNEIAELMTWAKYQTALELMRQQEED